MNEDGQNFLDPIADFTSGDFNARFSKAAKRIGVGTALTPKEQGLLCEAAFFAALCNLAFNGPWACGGEIRPEGETTRRMLEQSFMADRDRLFATAGWKALSERKRRLVQEVFLTVLVTENNLIA
jgi:hypothetical protein